MPVLLIAGLMYAVAWSIDHGPAEGQKRDPVGAGAGDTGGANAIGEALRDREAPRDASIREDSDEVRGDGSQSASSSASSSIARGGPAPWRYRQSFPTSSLRAIA
eukprot:TRINITY_DN64578_c0_g1_i5.p5 TRINITY_DN64578_c0_g1~~TRINITY_DN64578_c0_g1_i5.p5  ORF type:complete len:105 (+),score=15.80 TRINITY_DN64578_c0_g1_i5:384-698(+)